jgi:sugar phosphate isomerase/epimerase
MELAFFTDCLPQMPLRDLTAWAAQAGFNALEVATWPRADRHDTIAPHASHLDVVGFTECEADTVRELFAAHKLRVSALGYYENNLHEQPERRQAIHQHLRAYINTAAQLGVPYVGTFIGLDASRAVPDNLPLAEAVLPPLVDYAGEHGVKLLIENCPMLGWHRDGYPANLAYSQELWQWMFNLGFYLNYDPSHLVWQNVDPVEALRPHLDRVLHVQAKDTSVNKEKRDYYGPYGQMIGRTDPWDTGWWHYRVPGKGIVDWSAVIGALREGGYSGTVSIEHEDSDPELGGSIEGIKRGLEYARDTLRPLLTDPLAHAPEDAPDVAH